MNKISDIMEVGVYLRIDPYGQGLSAEMKLRHDNCPQVYGGNIVRFLMYADWLGHEGVVVKCLACQRKEKFVSGEERQAVQNALLMIVSGCQLRYAGNVSFIRGETLLVDLTTLPRSPNGVKGPSQMLRRDRLGARERHLHLVRPRDRIT